MTKWIERYDKVIIKLIVLCLFANAVLFNSIASAILVLCAVIWHKEKVEKPKTRNREPKQKAEPKEKKKEPDKVAAGVSRKA